MALRPNIPLHQYRGLKLKTAPATEPVTAADLRTQLVESSSALPDAEANALIEESRGMIEEMTGLALITQTWEMAIDRWPAGREPWWNGVRQGAISELHAPNHLRSLELPRYPLQSVDVVTVYDEGGNASTVTIGSTFDVDTFQSPGRVTLQTGATWPVALRANNAIVIEFTSGFGSAASDVPAILRRAVKQVAAYLYTHRGDDCQIEDALGAARGLLASYAVKRI